MILPFQKLTLKGEVRVGLKSIQCTFILSYSRLELDEKKSVAKCKGKVKKTTKIQNYKISGKELNFIFTLTIPKKGKITFSASSIEPVIKTTTEPTLLPTPSLGNTFDIGLMKTH